MRDSATLIDKRIISLLCIALAGGWLLVAQAKPAIADDRPRIGLALSGGGARGVAHIGVIRELEKQNIHVDYVAGTSMGAIIGGLYASGMNAEQIEAAYRSIDWNTVLSDSSPRRDLSMRRKFDQAVFQMDKKIGVRDGRVEVPAGLIRGQKLELELQRLLMHVGEINDFDQLPIPFRAVASNIATNDAVVLRQGSLSQALRASMAVPGVFTPVDIDDLLLVDGGITNNLPIDVVRDMGADIVIAVDIGSPLLKMDSTSSVLTIAAQLTNILVRRTTDQQISTLRDSDVLIVPQLGDYSASNFAGAGSLIEKGQAGASHFDRRLAQLAEVAPAAGNPVDCETCSTPLPVISYVRFENDSRIDDKVLRRYVQQPLGKPLDVDMLESDIARIYGIGVFDSVQYDLETEHDGTGLVLQTRQHPWGPNYLQLGLSLSSDFAKSNRFNIRLGYTKMPLNSLNGEWRTVFSLGEEPGIETQLYQPLAINSSWFVQPTLFAKNTKYNLLSESGEDILAESSVLRLGGSFAVGHEFGSLGDMQLGIRRYTGRTEVIIGDPVPDQDINAGETFFLARHDSLDNLFFPRRGVKADLGWLGSYTSLGADSDFRQARLNALAAATWKTHTLQLGGVLETTYDGVAPIQNYFRIGGLFNLPGYTVNELAGQNALVLKAGYMRAIKPLLSLPTYLGATVQYGDVYQDHNDLDFSDLKLAAAAYLGLQTVVGPVYVGYGVSEGGAHSIYLTVGGLVSGLEGF